MKAGILGGIILLALTANITYANEIMKPGAWQAAITITATHPSSGETINIGNASTTLCLTKDFLATDPYLTANIDREKMKRKGASCSNKNYSRSKNTASWIMTCSASGQTVITRINASVSQTEYTIRMNQEVSKGRSAVKSTNLVKAKHIGKCTKDMARP